MDIARAAAALGRYRVLAAALALSFAAHAAIFAGIPGRLAAGDEPSAASYSATLDLEPAPAAAVPAPLPQLAPVPMHRLRRLAPPPVIE
ncbi:MAG: hypothetical protein ACXWUU_07605, partial [Burkholderiales bacterium]